MTIGRMCEVCVHGFRFLYHKYLKGYLFFGAKVAVDRGVRVRNPAGISIGMRVHLQDYVCLNALISQQQVISIGAGTDIGRFTYISAQKQVTLGNDVLIAPSVYISDHSHEYRDISRPILSQGITEPVPVIIEDGCWIGTNSVLLPGTKLGRNCVVGANSVVKGVYPAGSVVVGAPARVCKTVH